LSTLRGLSGEIRRGVMDPNFRITDGASIEVGPYLIEDIGLGRTVSLDPLRGVIQAAMNKPGKPEKSDPWLAPRVHATLRLTRREAADKRIWNYLSVVEFPEYVRWRFRDEDKPDVPVPADRFLGEDSKNALARLWWAAELTRNGSDYSPTLKALANSRFATSWQHLDGLHHRAAALAVVEFLDDFDGKRTTDYQGQVMAKAFNLALRTLTLDALWQNPATDAEAFREWRLASVDETKMMNDLPTGPDEAPVPSEAIAAVRAVLNRLAAGIDLAQRKPNRRISRDEEVVEEEVDAVGQDVGLLHATQP
jgi:hypothetical protein